MRGFSNFRFRKSYAIVNVGDLERLADAEVVDRASLQSAGLIRKDSQKVKLLGDGDLKKAFKVKVDRVSASAKAKIEAAGGEVLGEE